jgi:hypothetical protein
MDEAQEFMRQIIYVRCHSLPFDHNKCFWLEIPVLAV